MFTDLWMLKNLCIPWMNPNWSWYMEFLMYCWMQIFFWGFLHICSSMILACNFLFVCCLCLVLVSGWWWPYKMSWEVFLPLWIFGTVSEQQGLTFLWMFDKIRLWSHSVLDFHSLGDFNHGFNFSVCDLSIHILCCFLV